MYLDKYDDNKTFPNFLTLEFPSYDLQKIPHLSFSKPNKAFCESDSFSQLYLIFFDGMFTLSF